MDGGIRLTAAGRTELLRAYLSGAKGARRAHIVLLLADGLSARDVRRVTYTSFDLIADCAGRFRSGRVEAVVEADRIDGGVVVGRVRVGPKPLVTPVIGAGVVYPGHRQGRHQSPLKQFELKPDLAVLRGAWR
jgi:hypothetical protein